MTGDRKKLITRSLAAIAVLVALWYVVDILILSPAADKDADIRRLNKEIEDLKYYNSREVTYLKRLKKYYAMTFSDDPLKGRELLRQRIGSMIEASGMRCMDDRPFSEVSSTSSSKGYHEVGWSCDLVGSLDNIVKMLYLLRSDPYLHKLQGLTISPTRDRTEARLSFRYTTLIFKERKKNYFDSAISDETLAIASLAANPENDIHVRTASRNLFRPYVKKKKVIVSTPPPEKKERVVTPPKERPPVYSRFKIVSLTRWNSGPEISIADTARNTVRKFKVGDALAGGTIVCVDYRQLPLPDNPEILSPSRIIIKIGNDYFAVELGRTLGDKHLIDKAKLPPAIAEEVGQSETASSDPPAG